MKHWARRVRGIVGTGTVWGSFGTGLGALFGVAVSGIDGLPALSVVWRTAFAAGVLSALMGTAFATILTLMEGRRTFEQLSAMRAGVWGAMAGALLPVVFLVLRDAPLMTMVGETLAASGLFGAAGAGMAAGTVLLARSAGAD